MTGPGQCDSDAIRGQHQFLSGPWQRTGRQEQSETFVPRNIKLSCNLSWSMPQRSRGQIWGDSTGPLSCCPWATCFFSSPGLWKYAVLIPGNSSFFSNSGEVFSLHKQKVPWGKQSYLLSWWALGRARELLQASCLFWLSKDFSLLAGSALSKILKRKDIYLSASPFLLPLAFSLESPFPSILLLSGIDPSSQALGSNAHRF